MFTLNNTNKLHYYLDLTHGNLRKGNILAKSEMKQID